VVSLCDTAAIPFDIGLLNCPVHIVFHTLLTLVFWVADRHTRPMADGQWGRLCSTAAEDALDRSRPSVYNQRFYQADATTVYTGNYGTLYTTHSIHLTAFLQDNLSKPAPERQPDPVCPRTELGCSFSVDISPLLTVFLSSGSSIHIIKLYIGLHWKHFSLFFHRSVANSDILSVVTCFFSSYFYFSLIMNSQLKKGSKNRTKSCFMFCIMVVLLYKYVC